MRHVQHQVQAEEAGRVDALVARLVGFSRARVRGLVEHGGVKVNGQECTHPATPVQAGDAVAVHYDPQRRYRERRPAERPTHGFQVAFVDEHLVVVVKEAGLLTVPTDRGEGTTLVQRLSAHLAKGQARRRPVAVVHRLDRETSGLLVFGRSPAVAKSLIAQFAAHKPEREYAALVAGRLAEDRETIRTRLVTDKSLSQRSLARSDPDREGRGELAVTHVQVERRFDDATLVAVRLETGRRNQIRVHLSEKGHPVLGDERYRPELAAHPAWPYRRLALHARVLGFRHPVTGQDLRYTAPLPPEFAAFEAAVTRGR